MRRLFEVGWTKLRSVYYFDGKLEIVDELKFIQMDTSEKTSDDKIFILRTSASAISALEKFSVTDSEEDQARSWIGRVKLALLQNKVPDQKKCVVFGGLISFPA